MAGVDGVSSSSFRRHLQQNLDELHADLVVGSYRPLPLLRVLVAGKDGSPCPYYVPTMRDRTAQAAVSNVLEPIFEALYQEDPFSCRRTGCVRHAAHQVGRLHENGYRYVVNGAMDTFFDTVDHEMLLGRTRTVLRDQGIVKWIGQWVKADVYGGESVLRREEGLLRGAAITPLLANLVLDVLDGLLSGQGQQMVRYGTDLVVLAKKPGKGQGRLEITPEVLAGLLLTSDPEDPGTMDFWKDLEMLGFLFVGDGLLAPLQRPARFWKILYAPPPLDLERYVDSRS
jgi:retron-type reverse transcriptase